ncbi:MAG TPA: hypothetical protein VNK46_11760 [Nitrospiraceae bacterium]|jgi:hypothetical protein|nr:hypothetical protein [Nitrospiraceae bacterium]
MTKKKNIVVAVCALSLLIGGVALVSSAANAAPWISAADSYSASWVNEIEKELYKKEYQTVFMNDPRTPQASVLRLLNRAAAAYEAKNAQLAEQFIREAISVLEQGVAKNYYVQSDIEPIVNFIKQHAPVKLS